MSFPALDAALIDRELSEAAVRVYRLYCCQKLDFVEPRAMKYASVSAEVHLSKPSVADGVKQLVARGYLAQGSRAWPGGPFAFRLVWSLPDEIKNSERLDLPNG